MNVTIGIASRLGPQQNKILKRCIESLQRVDPGVAAPVRIETGTEFTRGEKRQRIFTWARAQGARWACILEDDTEVLQPGWLAQMLQVATVGEMVGMMNPMETRDGLTPVNHALSGKLIELPVCYGFCILYDLSWHPHYDPRITWLDDLAMSLQCRAAGWRLMLCGGSMVRHTKEPFLRDDLAPWEQADRTRWGEGSAYYDPTGHQRARTREASILVEQYGDMARESLPSDLRQSVETAPDERTAVSA